MSMSSVASITQGSSALRRRTRAAADGTSGGRLGLMPRTALALAFGLFLAMLEAFGFREDEFLYRIGFWTTMMVVWVFLYSLAGAALDRTPAIRAGPVVIFALRLAVTAPALILLNHQISQGVGWTEPTDLVERLFNLILLAAAFEVTCWAASIVLRDWREGVDRGARSAALLPAPAPSVPCALRKDQAEVPTAPTGFTPARTTPALPLLASRLPRSLQGPVLCLEMEDHYVRVHTLGGSALLLMRLSDALAELEPEAGLQVHRSWWIAADALVGVERSARSVRARLVNGLIAPVSRPYVRAVEDLAAVRGLSGSGATLTRPAGARTDWSMDRAGQL